MSKKWLDIVIKLSKTANSLLCPFHSIQFSPLVFLPLWLECVSHMGISDQLYVFVTKDDVRKSQCGLNSSWICNLVSVVIFLGLTRQHNQSGSPEICQNLDCPETRHFPSWTPDFLQLLKMTRHFVISAVSAHVYGSFPAADARLLFQTIDLIENLSRKKLPG